ncbi:MAG TPA: LytTR family DNA-binding domain-containing protein [Chitinophagaceae bacterium]
MIKCIIVEDEILAQQVIQNHLEKIDSFELVGICNNALEARELLNHQQVDVIFLDIELPGMTGLNFLRSLTINPIVVLTTAYGEYALESYELNVIDYLLKPISYERFSKTINKILAENLVKKSRENITGDHFFVKSDGKFLKINFSDIRYVEGMKDYLKIQTAHSTVITHQTMSEMEKLLPAKQFIRVHKSYVVAIAHIRSIYGNSIETENKTVPIGINYKEKVMSLINANRR